MQNVDTPFKRSLSMRAGLLAQLPIFVAVAERRSFTLAAREVGMSASAVSQAIARLERELGTALLVRTTRSVRPTDAGMRLLAEAGPALTSALGALASIRGHSGEPTGVLRLNVPRIACRIALPEILDAFARRHPGMRVEVVVDDRRVDLVRDGFDVGIRSHDAVHKDLVRVRLTPRFRFIVVGAKRYFATRGRPKHPRDLVDHACLGWRSLNGSSDYRWEFAQRGRQSEVAVSGPLVSNDTELLVACATKAMGLAYVADVEVRRELAAGTLETVLADFAPSVEGLFLYFPRAARSVPRVRAFVECARE